MKDGWIRARGGSAVSGSSRVEKAQSLRFAVRVVLKKK